MSNWKTLINTPESNVSVNVYQNVSTGLWGYEYAYDVLGVRGGNQDPPSYTLRSSAYEFACIVMLSDLAEHLPCVPEDVKLAVKQLPLF